jgi:hypothetical protein
MLQKLLTSWKLVATLRSLLAIPLRALAALCLWLLVLELRVAAFRLLRALAPRASVVRPRSSVVRARLAVVAPWIFLRRTAGLLVLAAACR